MFDLIGFSTPPSQHSTNSQRTRLVRYFSFLTFHQPSPC